MDMEHIGRLAFLAGVVISVLAGVVAIPGGVLALVVLGIIVGLLNVTGKEVHQFLMAAIALILVGIGLNGVDLGIPVLNAALAHFVAFVAGAALIVALKEVWEITSSK